MTFNKMSRFFNFLSPSRGPASPLKAYFIQLDKIIATFDITGLKFFVSLCCTVLGVLRKLELWYTIGKKVAAPSPLLYLLYTSVHCAYQRKSVFQSLKKKCTKLSHRSKTFETTSP